MKLTAASPDIVDKELKALRNGRWLKAFDSQSLDPDNVHRKATIVIEHLIQASDVAHTMQHWIVFRKVRTCVDSTLPYTSQLPLQWNERLFAEMYKAFVEGRSEKDPSGSWYEGELGFFDVSCCLSWHIWNHLLTYHFLAPQ